MKHKVRYSMLALLLLVSLITVGCSNATALINAIVASTEAVLPFITQLSPSDQALVATYVNAAASITDTLMSCGSVTASCVATAVNQFNTLVLPTLSVSASPAVREALGSVAVAIAAFVAAEGGGNVSVSVQASKKSSYSISSSKRSEFKARLTVVKSKLVPYISH